MVMKPAPFFEASPRRLARSRRSSCSLLAGRRFKHADAERFAALEEFTLLCGHYKDVDQRVADHLATEELSLGDFVLSGGEPARARRSSMRRCGYCRRSHERPRQRPHGFVLWAGSAALRYTRPPDFRGFTVPDVLLSGNHAEIQKWRDRGADGRSKIEDDSRSPLE